MNHQPSSVRTGSLCLVLGCLVALFSTPALGAPAAPRGPGIPGDVRARLADAATNAADGSWTDLVPFVDPRCFLPGIYDPVRSRMIIFGGLYTDTREHWFNDVWALALTGQRHWTRLNPAGTPPPARSCHTSIYDPVRDRMIVFGGLSGPGPFLDDVWALSLGDTPTWSELTPTGVPPSGRRYATAIYDPVRDRMLVFGGQEQAGDLNDVWALSLGGTPSWEQLTPGGTPVPAMSNHSAIYDPVRDRMVVYGGSSIWALSLAGTPAWSPASPSGTPPQTRLGQSAVYDPVRDRMVVFAGYSSPYNSCFNDSWSLSLGGTMTWTHLSPAGAPPSPRYVHAAIYDPVNDGMIVFGGCGGWPLFYNDVSELSLAGPPAWSTVIPSVVPPTRRSSHSAIYDPIRDRMLVFGGFSGSYLNDLWALPMTDAPSWTSLVPTGALPAGRSYHSAIYDPVRDRMIVFGGFGGALPLNDVLALSLAGTPAWTALVPTGTPPSRRYLQSAIYDPLRDRMLVFGGADGSTYFNDVWALSLGDPPCWTALSPSGAPPGARCFASATYDAARDRMMIFGGANATDVLGDVWALSLGDSPAWMELAPAGTPPSPREGPTAIYDPERDRLLIFGGLGVSRFNDTWALTLGDTPAWTNLSPDGPLPSGRYGQTAIFDSERRRMVVFGGSDASGYACDVRGLAWSSIAGVTDRETQLGRLAPPVPNPTLGSAAVSYTISRPGRVRLDVYDVRGRLVRRLVDGERRAGAETVVWNGRSDSGGKLRAGVYFIRLTGPGVRANRKVILLE